MNPSSILALIFLVLTAMIVIKGVRIVRQSESMVIERLGKYRTTLNAGINIIIPIVDRPRDIVWRMSGELPDGTRVTPKQILERRFPKGPEPLQWPTILANPSKSCRPR